MEKHGNTGIFRMQLVRMATRAEFKIACVLSFLFIVLAFVEECCSQWGADQSDLYTAASGWVGNITQVMGVTLQAFYLLAISLIAALPFADSFLEDRKSHNLASVLVRTTWGAYRRTGIFLSFAGGFLVILAPLLVSQLLSFLLFPATGGKIEGYVSWGAWMFSPTLSEAYVFPYLLLNHPYLHNLVFIFYASLFGGMNAVASYLLSLLGVHKKLLVLGLPAVFWLCYDLLLTFINPSLIFEIYLYPNDSVFKQPWFFFALPLCMLAVLLLGAAAAKRYRTEAALQ
ncbi:hypothetical protein [Hydrogeniiclostridium mannosilyticum]|uniref:hypothetical protein n=1 Tax=Hydrogeniiclostridium mannosilyticum TaxID=2764322 RepID=UPI0018AC5B5F|nr:hypothetical protein [Hydrogeniiclostridium mannosilyticum]